MCLTEPDFRFDRRNRTYNAGETITGTFELVLWTTMKINSVLLVFKGEGKIRGTKYVAKKSRKGSQETTAVSMGNRETYLYKEYYCIGGKDGMAETFEIGKFLYPFSCVLPPNLPPTFEFEYGYIKYTATAIIACPMKLNMEFKREFTVLSEFDVKSNPKLGIPMKVAMEKYMCCLWCGSGPLTCFVTISKSGYVPGETLTIVAEIDNDSNADVPIIKFELQKVITCYSLYPRRFLKRRFIYIVEVVTMGPIVYNSSKVYSPTIQIPKGLPASNLFNCNIIDLQYRLKIVAKVDGFHFNLCQSIPIAIGTSPSAKSKEINDSRKSKTKVYLALDGPEMYHHDLENRGNNNQNTMVNIATFDPMHRARTFTNVSEI